MAASALGNDTGRALTIDDILNMEDVGRVALAPDERTIVYEHIAAFRDAPNVETLYFYDDRSALAKLYRVSVDDPTDRKPLFTQEMKGGYWLGNTSPNGKWLAVYSLVGLDLKAGIFDFEQGSVRWFDFTPNYFWANQSPIWISADEIIYSTIPRGELPLIVFRVGLAERIKQQWAKSFVGKEPSATVLVSTPDGVSQASQFRPGALVRTNARTGQTTKLGDGLFYNLKLSRDGRHLAALREGGAIQPHPDVAAGGSIDSGTRKELVIFDLQSGRAKVPCDQCDVPLATMEWSANSKTLAFFAQPVGKRMDDGQFLIYSTADGTLGPAPAYHGLVLGCDRIWSRPARAVRVRDSLAVFARLKSRRDRSGVSFSPTDCARGERHDWYLITPGGDFANLTSAFRSVSSELLGASAEAIFVVADGDVWKLGSKGVRQNLTRSIVEPVAAWDHVFSSATFSEEVRYLGEPLSSETAVLHSPTAIVSMDLERGVYRTVEKPKADAALVALSGTARTSVFRVDGGNSMKLIARRQRGSSHDVFATNQYLADVSPGREVQIQYSLAGESVSSCALLPPNWKPDQRYPLVVHVYPNVPGKCLFSDVRKFNPRNMQLLAAQGYVVLFPSTLKRHIATVDGPTQRITQVVLAAVDAAIDAGYADSDRLGLFGFSQGHHSVLQILSETRRFSAAVVSHGCADFASQYGAIPLFARLLPLGSVGIGNAERFESPDSDNYLGVRPWEDPDAYVRNSPVFYADRIRTPVLIFHSDFDLFPLEQSAEIFSALHRLRREVTYVTYWGEGHGLMSPANVQDMWQRIYAWYARHLNEKRAPE